MSLILYGHEDTGTSVILNDPNSRSLVLINKNSNEIILRRNENFKEPSTRNNHHCSKCGQLINETHPFIHKNYFKLLQDNTIGYIPSDLFVQGYFEKFFKELELLGNGARGIVIKVEHILLNNRLGVYALKKIPIGDDLTWLQKCMEEVKFLTSITGNCKNLIKYNHVWLEKRPSPNHVFMRFGSDIPNNNEIPYMFILQQFCSGGNLENVIIRDVFNKFIGDESNLERKLKFKRQKSESQKGLSSNQILSIIWDLANGLEELHSLNIIHRDLKPSNCLLLKEYKKNDYDTTFPIVVIGDFGESQLSGQRRTATGATGTLEFTAPEVLILDSESMSLPQFTFQSDMYSLGMIIYFIIFGELPFKSNQDMKQLKRDIKKMSINILSLKEKHSSMKLIPINEEILHLTCQLLSPNKFERLTATKVKRKVEEIRSSNKDITNKLEVSHKSLERHFLKYITLILLQFAATLTILNYKFPTFIKYSSVLIQGLSINCSYQLQFLYFVISTIIIIYYIVK